MKQIQDIVFQQLLIAHSHFDRISRRTMFLYIKSLPRSPAKNFWNVIVNKTTIRLKNNDKIYKNMQQKS